MATRVLDGFKFCEQILEMTSQGKFLQGLVQIGPEVWEEMFKTRGPWWSYIAHLSIFVTLYGLSRAGY